MEINMSSIMSPNPSVDEVKRLEFESRKKEENN